ncbi:MAG: hypothetical protein ACYTBJ_09810 [Planctomycetota bacterium]|jgi:hypothetical protein
MKFRHIFMFAVGHLVLSALLLGAGAAAYFGDRRLEYITVGVALVAFLLFDARTGLVAEAAWDLLPRLMPRVEAIVGRSIWSAFGCGGVVGVIDSAAMVIVGWPCWLLFKWFEGDSGYKWVGWSLKYVGRPKWQMDAAIVVLGLVFIFASLLITFMAVWVWNELLKKSDA